MNTNNCLCATDAARYRCPYAIPGTMKCDRHEKTTYCQEENYDTEERGIELLRHHATALYTAQAELCQAGTEIQPLAVRVGVAFLFVIVTLVMVPWFFWELVKKPDGAVQHPYID